MAVAVAPSRPVKLRKAAEPRGGKPAGRARVLVTVTVLGSAGPLRFLVDEGESVASLIRAALRCYAREGRMPLLGDDVGGFLLYAANGRSDALEVGEKISFNGCRSFLLWQKSGREPDAGTGAEPATASSSCSPGRRGGGGWKAGLNKLLLSFSFRM